jgi:large subunit ribosomal protein L9
MKIILTKDMENLGLAGDVKAVADGYGRNYLLPRKLAILATPYNLKKIAAIQEKAVEERNNRINNLKNIAEKVNGVELSFTRKVDSNEKMYGSISEIDIYNELNKLGLDVRKSNIVLEKHIKELGEFNVEINFAPEIKASIKILVGKE